jgi:hypothetical protein
MINNIIPTTEKIICNGTATFISFLTPESEVNVEEPVKFMAIKEEITGMIVNHAIFS